MLLQINWQCVKDTHTGPSELRSGGRGRYRALPSSARIEANDNSQLGPWRATSARPFPDWAKKRRAAYTR